MSTWGMIAIGLIYAGCSFDQFKIGNTGMGMAYAVYR